MFAEPNTITDHHIIYQVEEKIKSPIALRVKGRYSTDLPVKVVSSSFIFSQNGNGTL